MHKKNEKLVEKIKDRAADLNNETRKMHKNEN